MLSLSSWQKEDWSFDSTEQAAAIYLNVLPCVSKRAKPTWCVVMSSPFAVPCCHMLLCPSYLPLDGLRLQSDPPGIWAEHPHSSSHGAAQAAQLISERDTAFCYSFSILFLHTDVVHNVHMGFSMVTIMGWTF